MSETKDYEVGYGRPPKATQFRKGQSGNPHGRPRADWRIADIFRRAGRQKVRANGPDGPRSITKLEASVTQLLNKSASGNFEALRLLMQLLSKFPELFQGSTLQDFEGSVDSLSDEELEAIVLAAVPKSKRGKSKPSPTKKSINPWLK